MQNSLSILCLVFYTGHDKSLCFLFIGEEPPGNTENVGESVTKLDAVRFKRY